MKKIRFVSLLLAALLCTGMITFCSCGNSASAGTVTCKIIDEKGSSIYNDEVPFVENSTVYDVLESLNGFADKVNIEFNGKQSVSKVNDKENRDIEGSTSSYYWNVLVNDENSKMDYKVKDKDTVVLKYTLYYPTATLVFKNGDTGEELFNQVVKIEEYDIEEDNSISVISLLKQAKDQYSEELTFKLTSNEKDLRTAFALSAGEDEETGMTGEWLFAKNDDKKYLNTGEDPKSATDESLVKDGDVIYYIYKSSKTN